MEGSSYWHGNKTEETTHTRKITNSTDTCIELLLLRHGETSWNFEKRLQGDVYPGPNLNEKGIAQAHSVAELLMDDKLDAIVTSDLLRAQETATIIRNSNHGNAIYNTCPGLRERCLGPLSGMKISDAKEKHPEEWTAMRSDANVRHGCTAVESKIDFFERCIKSLEDLARLYCGTLPKVLIVSHGGVISMAYRKATGQNPRRPCKNASLNSFVLDTAKDPISWYLKCWNESSHLE